MPQIFLPLLCGSLDGPTPRPWFPDRDCDETAPAVLDNRPCAGFPPALGPMKLSKSGGTTRPPFRPDLFTVEAYKAGKLVELKPLGSGSFGSVMMVEDRTTGSRCALKRIDMRQLSQRKRAQALAEADMMRQLVHPCICGFYGSFIDADIVHIGMELCSGGTIDSWIESRRGASLPSEVILDCFLQVAAGLRHVHRRKVLRPGLSIPCLLATRDPWHTA